MPKTTVMFTQFSLPVVHPAFQLLKRSARLLHLVAAVVILANALHQWQQHDASLVLFITQTVIAADILILLFAGGPILQESPRLNLLFRMIETLVILGIGIALLGDGHAVFGWLHLLLAASFGLLLHREWRAARYETVHITQTGISLPNLMRSAELGWEEIRQIVPYYQSIVIETLRSRKLRFTLRNNLKVEELAQINEFCQKQLGNG
jgi:hypothetical protein